MRLISLISIILLLSCISKPKHEPSDHNVVESSQREIADTYFTKLTELGEFNGVVFLKKDNEIVLKKAYNMQSDTISTLHVEEESQFDLRSIAKLFAKLSILQLETEKRKVIKRRQAEPIFTRFSKC